MLSSYGKKNELTLREISKRTGVSIDTLYNIRSGRAYHDIAKKFTFSNETIESNSNYTDEMVDEACRLKLQGYNNKEITKLTGIKNGTLNDIFKGRRRKKFAKKYRFI